MQDARTVTACGEYTTFLTAYLPDSADVSCECMMITVVRHHSNGHGTKSTMLILYCQAILAGYDCCKDTI